MALLGPSLLFKGSRSDSGRTLRCRHWLNANKRFAVLKRKTSKRRLKNTLC